MAQQDSFIKLKGKIGDLTFYRTRNGYQVREKKGIDPNRIATDPKFQRTRENGAEFGRGVQAAKRLRDALRPVIGFQGDVGMPNRLSSLMIKVVKADVVNARGERLVLGTNTPMLRGFNFNAKAQLASTLFEEVTGSIDRATGALSVSVPAIDPRDVLKAPEGTTHYRFVAAGLTLDFAGEGRELVTETGTMLPVGAPAAATVLDVALTAALTTPIFLLFGIAFFQEVNGDPYPLQNGAFNVLTILEVNGV